MKINHRRILVGMLLAVAAATPSGAAEKVEDPKLLPAPPRVAVPKLQGTLTIDGEFTESVWKRAASIGPFRKNDGSGPEREATAVRIWYDNDALYLGWTCLDSDVQATFTARDSKFWDEEVAEFFVTPQRLDRYFELQWNPLGGVFDAIITNQMDERGVSRKFDGDWSFTAKGMKSAVKLAGTPANAKDRDERWQVEVRIPFADLGQPTPKPGDVWRANFYRINRAEGQPVDPTAWSPTQLPGFHQPARFGYLEFRP